jgi:fructose-1,6-bisphosphatase/inositol monophosphatase family enzyme
MSAELDLARELAYEAGAIMREHFRPGVAHRSKGDGSPVTIADEAINELVIARVLAHFPADGVIGEEGSTPAGSSARVWVCDPIDGTMPFTMGMPTNLFSLALVDDGEPVLGVLYDPYLDRLYEAVLGQGARVNGSPSHVSDTSLTEGILSVPDVKFGLRDVAGLASEVLAGGSRIMAIGSVTYVGALVASGQIEACVFPGTTVWDIAAVKVIVEESGGRVTDIDGLHQRYDRSINGALISNGHTHAELVQLVGRHTNTPHETAVEER